MLYLKKFFLLQILFNGFIVITSDICYSFIPVIKTRIQWNDGERLVSKRNFFGIIKYKYEPYRYSTVQNYHEYERIFKCCEGYAKVNETSCEPVCSPSCPSNTHCIRPDICECNWGYRGYTASPLSIKCEAFCKPSCDKNADCVEPNKCKCRPGYEDANGSGSCEPVCKNGCPENSNCTKPDQCICYQGYSQNGFGRCLPECNPKCPEFSDCIKPNTCICHENYKTEDDKCKPICEQICPQHAECVRPNECMCLEGYEPIENMDNSSFSCQPKCNATCPAFAYCAEPDKCACERGYNQTEQNSCEPICEGGCSEHSECTAPKTCTCDKGYTMLQQQCQPVCEKLCPEYATCSEPNKCQCNSGYQLKLSSIYNLYCEPVCQNNCSSFGKCVQPNKCECLAGYEMDEFEICQPVCSKGCKNGFCFQPDICICKPGYLMGPQHECEPVCSMVCQNGSCVEPEICQCHEGYKFENNSVNICKPACEAGCINGICVAPNVCICHENFEPEQTETGLNHGNCQVKETKTTTEKIITVLRETSSVSSNDLTFTTTSWTAITHHSTPLSLTTKPYPDMLKLTTSKPLVSAHICNDQCKCWQEDDELGSLTFQPCTHLCVDEFDKPCLDLKLCQCDLNKNQLVCRSDEDELITDDPIYYKCNLPRLPTFTTYKPLEEGVKSDIKSTQTTEESKFVLWWVVILGTLIALCFLALVVYFYLRKPQEPIMEYEL